MTAGSLPAAPGGVNAPRRRSVDLDDDKIATRELRLPPSFAAKGDTVVVRLLTPLAAWAALWSFAAFRLDPSAAAEGRFLASLAGGVLLCAALASRRPFQGLAAGAVLAVAAGWMLPWGPVRGSALVLVLVGTLAWVLAERWRTEGLSLEWRWALPAGIGIQLLLHAELLLPDSFGPRALVTLLVLPAVGTAAALWAARDRDPRVVGAAVGAGLVLAQGWSLLLTLGLLAWVCGEGLRRRNPWPALLLGLLGGGALVAGWEPREAMLVTAIAVVAWWSAADSAAEAARPRWLLPAGASLLLLLVLGLVPALGARPWPLAFAYLALVPLVLPWLLVAAPSRAMLVALAALAALRVLPGDGVLAPIVATASLTLPAEGQGAWLERRWLALLVGLTVVAGAYPWLREPAATLALDLLGIGSGWISALGVVAASALLVFLSHRGWRVTGAAAAGLALLAAVHLPSSGPDLLPAADALLNAKHPNWGTDLEPRSAAALVVDSTLAFGAALPEGTPVATVRCFHDDGSRSEWSLEARRGTGEWAARRSDVRAAAGAPPRAFSVGVSPDGRFLGQRYRALFEIEDRRPVRRVSVLRRPDLPPEVQLSLLRVELRP
ncbi:MAG: hypothetical protein KDD11_12820 [Acidobacteria bacterium]|nr:hypothetical protein [Acidobacteriota bacterium]